MSLVLEIAELRPRLLSLASALLMTAALFVLVVPLSHWLAKAPKESPTLQVSTVTLPSPPPQPPRQDARQETLEIVTSAPRPLGAPIKLEALPTNTPQLAGVTSGVIRLEDFPVLLASQAESPVFEVVDLDRKPQLLSNPARVIPYDLLRDKIRGQVRLKILISPNGHVSVLEVISADHERLIEPARRFAEKCRFESPLRNNQPVATAFVFPISF